MTADPDVPSPPDDDLLGQVLSTARPAEDGDFFEVQNLVESALFSRPLPQSNALGRYRLTDRILDRSWGTLWSATDSAGHQRYALWVVDALRSDIRSRADAVAKLRDPRLVEISDHGEDEDPASGEARYFLVEPWIRGLSLETWRDNRAPTCAELLSFWADTAEALGVAHRAGVVHGALDFESIVVGPRDVPGIVGLGLDPGRAARYRAPELAAGDATPAGDQYALARIIDESWPRSDDPEALRPRRLEAILQRAQAPRPDDRWPDMSALAAALARCARPRRRRFWIAAGLAASAVAAGVYAVEPGPTPTGAPCLDDAADALDDVWTPRRREELRARFGTGQWSTAGETTLAALDGYAGRWRAARDAACGPDGLADHVDGSCLADRAHRFTGLVDALAIAPPTALGMAEPLSEELLTIETCTSRATRSGLDGTIAADWMGRLYRAQALTDLGRVEEATAIADALTSDRQPERTSLAANELQILLGSLAERRGELDSAAEAYERALFASIEGRNMVSQLRAATRLGLLSGIARLDLEAALAWLRHGDELPADASDPVLRWKIIGAKAEVQRIHGHYAIAREINDRVVERLATSTEQRPWTASEALIRNARLKLAQGHYEEAESAARRALDLRTAAVGADHPSVATIQLIVAHAMAEQGRSDQAATTATAVLATAREHRWRGLEAEANLCRGRLAELTGDAQTARDHFEAGLRGLAAEPSPDRDDHAVEASLHAALARLHLTAADWPAARRESESALSSTRSSRGPNHPETLRVEATAGLVEVSAGNVEQGLLRAQSAFDRASQRWGTYSGTTNEVRRVWVESLLAAGDDARASAELDVMLEVTASSGIRSGPGLAWIWQRRAELARRSGDESAARSAETRAGEVGALPPPAP